MAEHSPLVSIEVGVQGIERVLVYDRDNPARSSEAYQLLSRLASTLKQLDAEARDAVDTLGGKHGPEANDHD